MHPWYNESMTPRLTTELDTAIRAHTGPLYVVGADERSEYVILSGEQYRQMQALLEPARLTLDEQREQLRAAGLRAGWDDPEMDAYDNYDAHRTAS